MSRNASGTYSLPAGQPVVSGTTISSSTFNTLTADLATELTDSLDRSGKGGMLAVLGCVDGTVAAPGITFNSDTDTGFFRIGANNIGIGVAGAKVLDIAASGLTLTGALGVTGQIEGPSGTVAAPALSFTTDPDCGLYRIGANNIGLALNGAKVVDYATTGVSITGTLAVSSTLAVTGASTLTGGITGQTATGRITATGAAGNDYGLKGIGTGTEQGVIAQAGTNVFATSKGALNLSSQTNVTAGGAAGCVAGDIAFSGNGGNFYVCKTNGTWTLLI